MLRCRLLLGRQYGATCGKLAYPFARKVVQVVQSHVVCASAVADVLEDKAFDKNIDVQLQVLFVDAIGVVVANFQQFCAGDTAHLFGGKQQVVTAAKQFVVFVVFA